MQRRCDEVPVEVPRIATGEGPAIPSGDIASITNREINRISAITYTVSLKITVVISNAYPGHARTSRAADDIVATVDIKVQHFTVPDDLY